MIFFGDDETDDMFMWSSLETPVSPKRLEAFVRRLHSLVPHIRWRIQTCDHDYRPYDVIVVPDEQSTEADENLEKVLARRSLRPPAPYRLYPARYAKKRGKWVIGPAITRFSKSADDFEEALLQGNLRGILVSLTDLVCCVQDLPDGVHDDDDLEDYDYSVNPPDFGGIDAYYYVKPYGSLDGGEYSLRDDLKEIHTFIQRGQEYFKSGEPAKMLDGARYWKWEHKWTWGEIAARVLSALSAALVP